MKPTKEDIERQVQDALERQEIRNVDYECLKNWANRLVDDAFDAQIRDKIYDLTNGESPLRHDAYMIVCEFGVMGLYEVPSRIRKLQAWKTNPDKNIKDWNKPFNSSLMSGLEEFFSQWQQLAADFVSLKLFIKKGRVKSDKVKVKETKNPMGTCQICQRAVCLMPGTGTLFLHGYQRPGYGFVVGECEGARYLPYEQSCDRTKEVRLQYEERLVWVEESLQKLSVVQELYWKEQQIQPNHPEWSKALAFAKSQIIAEIRGLKSEIQRLTKVITDWKKVA